MMRGFKAAALLMLVCCVSMTASAQRFKGRFINEELKINLDLNVYSDSLPVPGLEGLETCYGVLKGDINGVWLMLKVHEVTENRVLVRAACDRGNDAEDLELTMDGENLMVRQGK